MVRSQSRTTNAQRCSKVVTTSKLKRCSNIISTLRSKFDSLSTMNVVLTMSKSQRQIQNVSTTTSNSQVTNAALTLYSKLISQHIMDVEMAMSIQRCNNNVKFTTSSQCRYCDVAPTLRQLCEECKMFTIHDHVVTFPQPCIKVAKTSNNDTAFVWYAVHIQSVIFLSYYKGSKNCFHKI